ncbi:MAG: hypothetical protein OD814_000395 [Candidatus Alkanophagales archaeon MCA70_species_1]|nr:hypothetical protein [Candidatus Alkanophaga volatiphilum]
MPAACGVACEVCALKDACGGGCPPGNDEEAVAARLNYIKKFGMSCPILECAARKGVDFCLRCADFPCGTHYEHGTPFSQKFLDTIKEFKAKVKAEAEAGGGGSG